MVRLRLVAGEEDLQTDAQDAQENRVVLDRLAHVRLDDLHDDFLAGVQSGAMGLRQRSGTQWVGIDPGAEDGRRHAEVLLDQFLVALERDDGQAVKEVLELIRDGLGQEVLAQAEDLAKFDVGGAHHLQAAAELNRKRQANKILVQEEPGERQDERSNSMEKLRGSALRFALAHIGEAAAEHEPKTLRRVTYRRRSRLSGGPSSMSSKPPLGPASSRVGMSAVTGSSGRRVQS